MSSTCLTIQSPLSPFSLDLWDVTFNLLSQLITQLQTASHFQHCINQQNRDLNPGRSHLKSDSPPSELLRSKVSCLQSRLKQHSWKHRPFPKSLKSGVWPHIGIHPAIQQVQLLQKGLQWSRRYIQKSGKVNLSLQLEFEPTWGNPHWISSPTP